MPKKTILKIETVFLTTQINLVLKLDFDKAYKSCIILQSFVSCLSMSTLRRQIFIYLIIVITKQFCIFI